MPSSTTIVADVHEEKSGVPALLEELGAVVKRSKLEAGDYVVASDTIVERKRVLDLHNSITKGRLWAQIGKLRSSCPYPYLLVEGTDLDRGPLHPNAIRGACLAAIDLGVALIRSDHQRDSARWLYRLAVRCQREEPPAERPLYAGISVGTARALLERFGSVAGVLRADPEEWLDVPGVGRKRARVLAETLTHHWGSPR